MTTPFGGVRLDPAGLARVERHLVAVAEAMASDLPGTDLRGLGPMSGWTAPTAAATCAQGWQQEWRSCAGEVAALAAGVRGALTAYAAADEAAAARHRRTRFED